MAALQDLLDDLTSGDDARAYAAVAQLATREEAALGPIQELARSEEPEKRWWAVYALIRSPHTRADQLARFLDDTEPAVRQAAILGLAEKAEPAAIDALVRALADPDSLAASLAANSLVKAGVAAVPALIGVAEHGLPRARIMALRALAEIGDHRAIPVMMKVMDEDSALLQHWAKEGLERLGLDMVYIKP